MRTRDALKQVVCLTDDAVMITAAGPLDEPGPAIVFVNRAFQRLTGYPAEEAIGRSPRFLQVPGTDPGARRRIRRALERQEPVHVELLNRRRDGTPLWIDLAIHPIRNRAGVCENFLGILHDISELKRVETALRQSEARLRAVAELLPMAVAVTRESDGRILHANPWLASFYGTDPDGIVGRSITEIYRDLRDREHLRARLRRDGVAADVEIEGRRPDGTPATALVSARRIVFDGEPAILVVGTDISERKRLERRLQEAERQAREAMETAQAASLARMRFVAAASHDLRQPYQAMRLLLPLLMDQLTTRGQREVAHRLAEAMTVGETLLNLLLDASAMEAGTIQPKPTTFRIRGLVERLRHEFEEQARSAGLKFRVIGCDEWVRSDAVLLQRILSNLLSNALRYTSRGGVLLACRRRGGRVRIEVWDTGVGIPPELSGRIFEEFVQLRPPGRGRDQGFGLGLSVVAGMARLLDHPIDLRSMPGRGSVFSIEVPLVRPTEPAKPAPAVLPAAGMEGHLVLVVDDDPFVLDSLCGLLGSWGLRTLAAHSLEEMEERLAEAGDPPRLILTDYHLPGARTAADVVARVHARYRRDDIPAIVLTAETDPARLQPGTVPRQVLLHKPVDVDTLHRAVGEMLVPG